MSILIGVNKREQKLGVKLFIMALARSSFGMNPDVFLENQAMDKLCIEQLEKSFEPYRKKHIANGFGDIELHQIFDRGTALKVAYRCYNKVMTI